jgi:hypothetical protein
MCSCVELPQEQGLLNGSQSSKGGLIGRSEGKWETRGDKRPRE